jgi:hypothetical protein
MTEIKTTRFSLSANDLMAVRHINNKMGFLNDLIGFILYSFLILSLAVLPVIILGLIFPLERSGIIPDMFATLKDKQFMIRSIGSIVVLECIFYPPFTRWRMRHSYRAHEDKFKDIEMHFTDQGVDYFRPASNFHFDWSYFQSVMDHEKYFLLVYGKNRYYAIPKSALSESQAPALTEMLKSHIGRVEIRD